jgi:probable HAF family extracellular repeat protein
MPSAGPSATTCAVAILLASCGGAFADVSFTPLGDLPGGSFFSTATAISSDGSVIVGYSATASSAMPTPFRWTRESGMIPLGLIPDPVAYGFANGLSRDGRVTVGLSAGSGIRPVKWIAGSGPIELALARRQGRAIGASADGSVIVGSDEWVGRQAVMWRGDEPARLLGYLPTHDSSRAMAVSPDGSLVVGWGQGPGISPTAFRWTEAEGMQPFDPPEATITMGIPYTFSDDGTTIVGRTKSFVASRWTAETGTVALPHLAGVITVREAFAVSADGSTIGGRGATESGDGGFIWTLSGGTELAFDFFTRHGLTLSGWQISVIAGVSADGKTFTGTGVHDGVTEAFVAVIPAPGVIAPFAILVCRRRR